MSNNKSFNILLTNRYLEEGVPADISSKGGIMKFRLPENIVIPSHAQIEIISFTTDSDMPQEGLILSVEEFNNSSWVGDNINGRRVKGFIGLISDDVVNKKQFNIVDLNNTTPINIQELTLKIDKTNGLKGSFNKVENSANYDLTVGNPYQRDGTTELYDFVRIDDTHWKSIRQINQSQVFYEFQTPTSGINNGISAYTFTLDTASGASPTIDTSSYGDYTANSGAGLTAEMPLLGTTAEFCIQLKIKQDPQYQMNNIMRENNEYLKGLMLNRQENNQ